MANNLTQRLLTYSYADRPEIDLSGINQDDPDIALLVQVNSLMSQASTAFAARRYGEAIDDYQAAQSLIYSMIDAQWTPGIGLRVHPVLSVDPAIFEPMVSAAAQWLNILPVTLPASPVRPTSAVPASALGGAAALHGAGLDVVSANPAAASAALADLHLAQIYSGQGNTQATTAAVDRATSLDPALARELKPSATTEGRAAPLARTSQSAVPARARAVRTKSGELAASPVVVEAPPTLPMTVLAEKQVGFVTRNADQYSVRVVEWAAGAAPAAADITTTLYETHITTAFLPDVLNYPTTTTEQIGALPHDYFYVIPLALAECYEAIGDYADAETYYLQAAGYQYLNTATEGPYVWLRLATLYSEWGDSLYQQDDRTNAAAQYGKVMTVGSTTPPSTPLYTLTGLSVGTAIATALLPQLPTLATTGVGGVSADHVAIASILLKIYGKLGQIGAGLDFWGNWSDAVPIWSFKYLQQIAVNFAQLAMGAEQEVINWWAQADAGTLTQAQLQNQADQAGAQQSVASDQLNASLDQVTVYQDGVTLAQTRATDAAQNASEYASLNSQSIVLSAESSQVSGGDDGDYNGVSAMAAQLLNQGYISGSKATVAAADQLAANTLSQSFQVDSMNRTTAEMQAAATQAQAQLTAANAQASAAMAQYQAAVLDSMGAQQVLATFNAATFTPQVWRAMGDSMLAIYQRYFDMALKTAKLMQQAYNFENDTTLTYIKDSYAGVVDGLLAADALMADIQQFTFDLITAKRGKKQLVKTSISLATRYGYLFQTQFVQTGQMAFETTLDDFDSVFPGSYQSRIRSVSVDIQGIVPPTGLSGSLTNGGISFYRLPSDIASENTTSKVRIQNSDTLVLSDYSSAVDGTIDSQSGDQMGIFEGAGVAGTWNLSLPKQLNDINYGTLTDVVLTFLFETRFDQQLVPGVLSDLASRPGYLEREWAIPLAWLYPDLFYTFVNTGTLTLSLGASDFALNQTNPTITAVSVLATMKSGTSASGITLSLTAPGKPAVSGVTDATGAVTSQGAGSTWAGAVGGSAYGDWVVTLPVASNPSLAPGGQLDLSSLVNLVLVLDYSFTPRS